MIEKVTLGQIGEGLILAELGKLGIGARMLPILRGVPDIIIDGGRLVEVKTSILRDNAFKNTHNKNLTIQGWSFAQMKRSKFDFIVFVLLKKDYTPYKIFSAKKSDISDRDVFSYRYKCNYISRTYKGINNGESNIENIKWLYENLDAFLY